ncbi:MAG: hypothetical protein ACREFE_12575 [Limisphaerales bacterium]
MRVEEAALLLGFSVHEIPILAAHGLIKPLGHPLLTGVKYFSVTALEELRKDEKWLARASDCIVQYWQNVNQKRKTARHDQNPDAPRGQNRFKRQIQFSEPRFARRYENATE